MIYEFSESEMAVQDDPGIWQEGRDSIEPCGTPARMG